MQSIPLSKLASLAEVDVDTLKQQLSLLRQSTQVRRAKRWHASSKTGDWQSWLLCVPCCAYTPVGQCLSIIPPGAAVLVHCTTF